MKSFIKIALIFCTFILFSCNSLKRADDVSEPLSKGDVDVAANEKKRISELILVEPVEALWRAELLGDEETIGKCVQAVNDQIDVCMENKNYYDALRYSKSLHTVGKEYSKYPYQAVNQKFLENVPGLSGSKGKNPKNIPDCVKATVTVFVDKGIKVENGAGMLDKVLGSGFFIDSRGYIITNHHVIADMVDPEYEGFSRLYVKFSDDEESQIPAKVIGYDSSTDLALIKVELEPEYVLALGSSSDLNVGDKINVIGAPLGLEGSMSSGIVSSTDRKLFSTGSVFQIDAPVNSGNSGGPCIDKDLKVQAIVFAGVLQAQGLNFAIPVEYLKQELPYLYYGGELNHVWIGSYGHTKRNGNKRIALDVQYVMPGGSAAKSGIKQDDVITRIDGVKIPSVEKFQDYLRSQAPNTIVKIDYESGDEEKSAFVYLEKRPETPAKLICKSDLLENYFLPLFGAKLIPSSTLSKKIYKIEKVITGTGADEMKFSPDDQISVLKIETDERSEVIFTTVSTKLRKKGFLEFSLVLATGFDSPYYF